MHTHIKLLLGLFTLLSLLSIPQSASAYYDPGVQRWIHRDPIGEPGFRVAKRHSWTSPRTEVNPYLFVENGPTLHVDPKGLQRVDPEKSMEDCLNNCDWDWRERKRKSISLGWRCAGYFTGAVVGSGGLYLCCVGAWLPGLPAAIIGYGGDIALWIVDEKKDKKFDQLNQAAWVQCCKNCEPKYPNEKDEAEDHIKRNHRGGPIW